MRYILALMSALPLLMAASLEADAGLVEDLRSGKSNDCRDLNVGFRISRTLPRNGSLPLGLFAIWGLGAKLQRKRVFCDTQ